MVSGFTGWGLFVHLLFIYGWFAASRARGAPGAAEGSAPPASRWNVRLAELVYTRESPGGDDGRRRSRVPVDAWRAGRLRAPERLVVLLACGQAESDVLQQAWVGQAIDVLTCPDLAVALVRIGQSAPDMVIVGGSSGPLGAVDFLLALRQVDPDTPVIVGLDDGCPPFVTDAEEKVLSDEHFVFFNALETPGGEVRLEIETNGESRLAVDLDELSLPGVRVVVGASLAGGRTFGELGPVELTLRDSDGAPWARTVLDAGTTENSLVLAEFYQRGGQWRFRAVGQGYEEPLAGFAVRHGVDIAQ